MARAHELNLHGLNLVNLAAELVDVWLTAAGVRCRRLVPG